MKKSLGYLLVSILLFSLSGCLTTQSQPSQQQVAMQQQVLSQLMNGSAMFTQQQPVQTQTSSIDTISEDELSLQVSAFAELAQPVAFERKKDGFDVNGMRYIDPEGAIISYGFDVESGDVTYVAQTAPNTFLVKYTRALSQQSPVLMATAQRNGATWQVSTVTGRTLSGYSLTPLSKGFLVSRDTAGFIYEPGKNLLNIGTPEGFHIAAFQNGEVLKTGFVLLEKDAVDEQDQVGSLFDSVKSLGSSLGINKKEDYLLYNVKNGRQVLVNIDASGKNVAVHSKCRQVNSFVRDCQKLDHFESLFNKHGQPNGTHYFWRVSWFSGLDGTYLISEEGTKVVVTNVDTGKQAIAFSRMMGVNYILADRTPDKKIRLRAKLGFNEEQIDDVEAFFKTAENALKG